jgi:hypothetical protein
LIEFRFEAITLPEQPRWLTEERADYRVVITTLEQQEDGEGPKVEVI